MNDDGHWCVGSLADGAVEDCVVLGVEAGKKIFARLLACNPLKFTLDQFLV